VPKAIFETPEGEDIEIDSEDVVGIRPGELEETTVIELDDDEEVTVVAGKLEAIATLGLDPLDHVELDDVLDDPDTAGEDDDDLSQQ